MWISNDIIENNYATINIAEETVSWKAGMFNPKLQNKIRESIKASNEGRSVSLKDFTL